MNDDRAAAARSCVRCGVEVAEPADRYQVGERMHWRCFHFSCPNRVTR